MIQERKGVRRGLTGDEGRGTMGGAGGSAGRRGKDAGSGEETG